jgi:hypothetical protein
MAARAIAPALNLFAVAALAAALGPAPARAENHFLAEANGGLATPLSSEGEVGLGAGLGATFGVGGRIKGFSPAWYLVGRLGYATATETGPGRFGTAEIDRGAWEAAVGGRVYFNLTERLRVLFELDFGEVWETSTVSRAHQPDLVLDANPAALFMQSGLQYRLTDHFSLGAGADLGWYLWSSQTRDLAATAAGIDSTDSTRGRFRFGLTTTAHF